MPSENTKSFILRELVPIFIVFLLIYLYTVSQVLAISHDSINYSHLISKGIFYFHPHHLLYNHFSWLWMQFWMFTGASPSTLIASLNSLFGAMAVTVIYSIIRKRIGMKALISVAAVCLPAFSYGFWFYSSCVEVYIIPLFFILLTFFILTSDLKGKYWLVGLFHSLAMLFHQLHFLFIIPIVGYMFLVDRKSYKSIWREFWKYAIASILIVGIPYILVILFSKGFYTIHEAWNFITYYSANDSQTHYWQPWNLKTIPMVLVGFLRSIFTSHYLFAMAFSTALLHRVFPDKHFADEAYLVRNLTEPFAIIFMILSVIFILTAVFLFIKNLKYFKIVYAQNRNLIILLLLQLIPYTLFFSFWDTANQEFWIPQSVFVWLGFIIIIKSSKKLLVIPMLAILLAFVNYGGSLHFSRDLDNDYYLTNLKPVSEIAGKEDLVIIEDSYYSTIYMNYLTDSKVESFSSYFMMKNDTSKFISKYSQIIDNQIKSGFPVYIVRQTPKTEMSMEEKAIVNRLWADYQPRMRELIPGNSNFYIIKR